MRFSLRRSLTIAKREYRTTVRRRGFMFTVIFLPAYFAFVMTFSTKFALDEARRTLREMAFVGVVDSTGEFANAPRQIRTQVEADADTKVLGTSAPPMPLGVVTTGVRFYADRAAGERALRAHEIQQLLVLPPDYLAAGKARRYALSQNLFSSGSSSDKVFGRWISGALLASHNVDSTTAARVVSPGKGMDLLTLDRSTDQFALYDDKRELVTFLMPMALTLLLAISIITGGQYLLQGVAEERESRILESLLCTVSTDDLMIGKLIGLGGAGLTLVGTWTIAGLYFGGPLLTIAHAHVAPGLLAIAGVYFVFGYLFYASILTAIGAITSNLREAQQFAWAFTFALMIPVILMWAVIGHPDGALAVGLSMFPMTAPSASIMRLATGSPVPAWQVATSIAILAATSLLTLRAGARVFRIGLLLYGKTPNLPEILKWATSRD